MTYNMNFTSVTKWTQSNSSSLRHLRLVSSNSSKNSTISNPESEMQKLTEELVAKVEQIKRVIAVATSYPDIHWIDFKIELKTDVELPDETWENIQDMVIDCEWKLIDDSGEEWYFRPLIVDKLYFSTNQVIADSDLKVNINHKVWSTNPTKFTLH